MSMFGDSSLGRFQNEVWQQLRWAEDEHSPTVLIAALADVLRAYAEEKAEEQEESAHG